MVLMGKACQRELQYGAKSCAKYNLWQHNNLKFASISEGFVMKIFVGFYIIAPSENKEKLFHNSWILRSSK